MIDDYLVNFKQRGQITNDVLCGSFVNDLLEGARITALVDMCHSGTVAHDWIYHTITITT